MRRKDNILLSPQHLFLLLALPFGVLFTFLLPPLGGPDEYFHYQRIAAVAYGHIMNEDATVPNGVAQFLEKTLEYLNGGGILPYTREHFFAIADLQIGDSTAVLKPNPMVIHNAACYIPQAIVFRLGAAFGASPLILLYITRLTALLASVWVTFHAIRIIPCWRYGLCALALLPPLAFYRTCLSADSMTTAFGMLFLASVMREIVRMDVIRYSKFMRVVVFGLLVAICKFPYAALTFMTLAISSKRFGSRKEKMFWCLLTILPGIIIGVWWLEVSRASVFVDAQYTTWGGDAYPDGQVAYILSDPAAYVAVIARTVFSFSFYVDFLGEMFGHFGTMAHTMPAYYVVMVMLLWLAFVMDGTSVRASFTLRTKLLTLPVVGAFMLLTLTALYVHWTGWKAPVIKGFQGRYLYPLLPLLLMVMPMRGRPHSQAASAIAVTLFAVVGLSLTVSVLLAHWK